MQQKRIALAVRLALTLAGFALATAALAQSETTSGNQSSSTTSADAAQTDTTAPANTKTLQAINVTGSKIRSVDVETSQPVTEISHQAIQQQGFNTVGEILQNVPSVGSAGTSNSSALGNIVGQYASLRGLGAPRTLILVDGQRWGNDLFGETDLSTIPASIIDRVEILQDGASAIYGSDAIAGVINIITKKNYDGVQINTYNSTYSPGNIGKQGQFSLTAGKTWDRGSILFNATASGTDAINANQRSFSRYGFFSDGPNYPQSSLAGQSQYGQITGALDPISGAATNQSLFANGPLIVNMGQDGRNINNYHVDTFGVQYPSPTFNNDYANPAYQETLLPDNHQRNYLLKGTYKVTDNINATFDGTYNTNSSLTSISGYPLSSFTPANGANLAAALGLPAGTFPATYFPTLSSNSYYNPLPGNNLQFSLPLIFPDRYTMNHIKQDGFRVGLDGEFTLGTRDFNWDAGYSDFRYDQSSFGPGNLNMVHLEQAVGPSFMGANGVVQCGTPGNVIAGCVPLNPFSSAGGLSPAETNYLNIISGTRSFSESKNAEANLSGDVFTLPQVMGSGDVTFATGLDHRGVSGGATPDTYTQLGLNTNLQQNAGAGSYDVNEAYAEFNIPVLKDLPGAQLVDLDVARRYSHYSNFGTTDNNQFKLSWKPIDDLLLRGSYGTGFRAPSIGNLYGGTMQSFTNYTDPCDVNFGLTGNPTVAQRCQNGFAGLPGLPAGFTQLTASGVPVSGTNAQGTTPFYAGANAKLQPETSRSATLGFVYSPQWLAGLNVGLDWYKIKISNVIALPTASSILDNCYLLGEAEQCAQFQRGANGQVINLLQAQVNEGFVQESGYDLALSYLFPATPIGNFKIDSNSTYVDSLHEQATPGGPVTGTSLGGYDAVLGPVWRTRSTVNLNWNYGNFGATWTLRYYSALEEPCAPANSGLSEVFPCNEPNKNIVNSPGGMYRQGALAFNDVQLHWKTPWKGQINVGATDVFNRIAPLSYTGVQSVAGPLGPEGTDGYSQYPYNPQYDIGRVIYIKYEQTLF